MTDNSEYIKTFYPIFFLSEKGVTTCMTKSHKPKWQRRQGEEEERNMNFTEKGTTNVHKHIENVVSFQ